MCLALNYVPPYEVNTCVVTKSDLFVSSGYSDFLTQEQDFGANANNLYKLYNVVRNCCITNK